MARSLVVHRRFRGPPDSGNGGWTCGALAGFVEGDAVVTLRSPPPLDTALTVEDTDDGVRLVHGEVVVAEASATTLAGPPPPFVDLEAALAASARYAGFVEHAFPSCFTCGTGRAEGDGLRVFTGPVEGSANLCAAPWHVHESHAFDGEVPVPVVWAAVDCPSVWPHLGDGTVAVLGRLAGRVVTPPEVRETYVVVGEGLGAEGRKRFGRAGVFDLEGRPLAWAEATWITLDR
jgi:hypothetical protein